VIVLEITSPPMLVIDGTIVRYTGSDEDLKSEIEVALAAV
jgi:hypothetical protein